MTRKSFLSLLLALVVPVVCYFIVKALTDKAVVMPRHYYADSIVSKTVKGKLVTDTIWHKLPDIELTNQLGKKITWDSMKGKVVVADFFFTHCPTICPRLTLNMKRLQESITNSQKVGDTKPDFLQFLSFSIDPERDSVEALKRWADRFQINPEAWWLLTGSKKEIYDLSENDMKIGLQDGHGIDSDFIHTDLMVLVDTNRIVRGYYHGLDSASLSQLSKDIIFLTLEKDKSKKSFLAGQLELIAVVFLLTLIALGIFLYLFKRKP
ncbi:MAG: SCO family protein [Bacteroidetes bacterium]|nr:SCO family protein [Bacteroidota bacterium]